MHLRIDLMASKCKGRCRVKGGVVQGTFDSVKIFIAPTVVRVLRIHTVGINSHYLDLGLKGYFIIEI